MFRIAVRVLAVLAVAYGATGWSHGLKAHSASKTGPLVSEQAHARTTPPALRDFPDLVTLITEED